MAERIGRKAVSWIQCQRLFTNIPLDETINICSNELFDKKQYLSNLDRASFEKLLRLATKELFFIFYKTFYKQLDSVAMGSPLGPTLANAFLCYHEKRWLDKCHEKTNNFRIKLQESIFNTSWWATVKQNIWVSPFDVILLRRIIFVASRHCVAPQSPLISDY